jgi:hypothetical protein
MPFSTVQIRSCHLLTTTEEEVALALGCAPFGPDHARWMSRFCASSESPCTLGPSDALDIVAATKRHVRLYRAACLSGTVRNITATLESLFFEFLFPTERCLWIADEDCLCSWQRRSADIECLTDFAVHVAQVHWSLGADSEFMAFEQERVGSYATSVADSLAERDGIEGPFGADDTRPAARIARAAGKMTSAASGIRTGNWGDNEPS